jgi:hypothetical protein
MVHHKIDKKEVGQALSCPQQREHTHAHFIPIATFSNLLQGILEVIIKGIKPNAHEVLDNDICA